MHISPIYVLFYLISVYILQSAFFKASLRLEMISNHQVQPLTQHNYLPWTIALNAMSSHFLNTSRVADFTISLPLNGEQIIPTPKHPFGEKIFLMFNLYLSWYSFRLCLLVLLLVSRKKRQNPSLPQPSTDKDTPQSPFLQDKYPQIPLATPYRTLRLVLQNFPQLHFPSLDKLQPLNVFLVVAGPNLDTGFKVWSDRCWVQGLITAFILLVTLFLM